MDGSDTSRTITRRHFVRGLAAGLAAPGLFPAGAAARDPAGWHLSVRGAVDRPLALSLDDLTRLGGETTVAFFECAGTGRVRNVTWTGVPLYDVLDLAGVGEGAVAAVGIGADGHRRTIPLRDVPSVGPLLALAMDGAALPKARGGPVRLIVPGWAAEASVKSLAAIELVERVPVEAASPNPADRRLRPLREMPPRGIIVSPEPGFLARAGRQEIRGYAWSGYAPVETVAVTTDGGSSWRDAEIVERTGPRGWVAFRAEWEAQPGPAILAARATDAFGLTQPLYVPDRARGFARNAVAFTRIVI